MRIPIVALVGMLAVALAPPALADPPQLELRAFGTMMTPEEEVPPCLPALGRSSGVATFFVVNPVAGTVWYHLEAYNIPGAITEAHIHIAPPGVPGPIVQPLPLIPGVQNGVVGEGTFTNPALLAALAANPENYYVNVHSTVCPMGVIRGQLRLQPPAVIRGQLSLRPPHGTARG